jgi:penicillin amidase
MRLLAIFLIVFLAGRAFAQESRESLRAKGKAVLSPLAGKLSFAGLKEPVEVVRDQWGVAHIYAKHQDDLFFAQGVVVAQDRLYQIDWWRRVTAGETAEVLGPSAVEADRFARLIRYCGDMDREWASYAPDARAIATAFTRGINAWIDHIGDRLPIEFQVLKHKPKRWQPEDVLGRMSGIVMSRNMEQEIARAQVVAAVGVDKARLMAPTDPAVPFAPAPELDLADIGPAITTGYKAASKSPEFKPSKSESNNWVVDGSLSASGKPLLASDPHRTIALPSLRYLVHLHAPGWNVIGSGEPALPGVALGHNERIAWGFTIVGTDQTDLYVEKTDPADPRRYLTETGWQAMRVVRESIDVRGKKEPVAVELRFTRHGPVLHQDEKKQRAVALKWAGSEPGGAAYLGSLSVARAQNQADFLRALEAWKIPGLNFVYADVDGNVGWIAAALTPVRKNHNGLLPIPGWTGGYEWQRYLSVAELPQRFNPPEHWLASANHNIMPAGYKHEIGYEFSPPHRFLRIQETLGSGKKFDLDDFQKLQHDAVSLPGRALGKLIGQVPELADELKPYARALAAWDGHLSKDSKEGLLYAVWLHEITKEFYEAKQPKLAEALRSINNIAYLLRELENPNEVWFGGHPKQARDHLLTKTLARAATRAAKLAGPDFAAWRWGKVHVADFRHPLGSLGPAHKAALDLGPVERTGDGNTPNNTRHDDTFRQIHGASYRHVLDLADWDRGLATSTPGQSGQVGSPHYGDLLPLWAERRYFPLSYSRAKVDEVARHRLWLAP